MANQTYEYAVIAEFENGDNNITIWDSTQHSSDLKGKFISVVIDLRCVARNTAQNKNGTYSIILESGSGMFDTKEIEVGTKSVKALTINPDDWFAKVLAAKLLANDGNCDLRLIMKKTYSTFSDKISGEIRGTIKCTVTAEEDKDKDVTVGLDKNAISDWFKTLSADGINSGQQVTDQYTIQMNFSKGKAQNVIWTNKGNNNNTINEISISLSGNVLNNATSQRVIDVDVVAVSGDDTFDDNMTMEIVQANRYAQFDTSGLYTSSQLPNGGNCEFKIVAKNTTDLSGEFVGNVIIKGTTVSSVETEETIDDTDIDSIMKSLFGDGYSASDDTDSFMSAYNGLGDSDDKDLLSADGYKNAGMTDAMAAHIQELEARITALENRMTELSVGGEEVDWYDGGYNGTDSSWGVGDWYKQTDERVSQTEEVVEERVEMLQNSSQYSVDVENKKITEIYSSINSSGGIFKNVTYDIMVSHLAPKQLWIGTVLNFYLQSEYGDLQNKILKIGEIKFSNVSNIVTESFNKTVVGSELCNNGNCIVKVICEYISPYNDSETTQELFDDLIANLKGKVTANLTYQMQEDLSQAKVKTTDEQEITVDMSTFDGTQTLFSYDAQSDNKNLQSVDLIFTFSYNYSDSQVCVGKKLKLDFNTVAVRPGFPDILTSYPIMEDTISASDKQKVINERYTVRSFANNGHCMFKIDFSVLGLSTAELADLKQHFVGKIKGTIKYTAVNN